MFKITIREGEEYNEVADFRTLKFAETEEQAIEICSDLNEQMDQKLEKLVDGDYAQINSPYAVYEEVQPDCEVLVACPINGVQLAESYADVSTDFSEVELLDIKDFYESLDNTKKLICGRLNNAETVNRIVEKYAVENC